MKRGAFKPVWLLWYLLPLSGIGLARLLLLSATQGSVHNFQGALGMAEGVGLMIVGSVLGLMAVSIGLLVATVRRLRQLGPQRH